jgi:hypothetical protein
MASAKKAKGFYLFIMMMAVFLLIGIGLLVMGIRTYKGGEPVEKPHIVHYGEAMGRVG